MVQLKCVPNGSTVNKSALVQETVCRQTEPMLTKLLDAIFCHYATVT